MTVAKTTSAPAIQPDHATLVAAAGEVLRLYNDMDELVKSGEYKVLQAAAKLLRQEEQKAILLKCVDSDDEEECGDENEVDEDDEDDDPDAEPQEIEIDFKEELAAIKKMDKNQLKSHVKDADRQFSMKFRKVALQVSKVLPGNKVPPAFAIRMLETINARLSDAEKRIAISPISLQLDTDAATNDKISKVVIAWTFACALSRSKYKFDQALEPLKEMYLSDNTYDDLPKDFLELEVPKLHEDLRLGDLVLAATDLIVLPFQAQFEDDSSPIHSWRVRPMADVLKNTRFSVRTLSGSSASWDDDDLEYARKSILDNAVEGDFSDRVMSQLAPIVEESTTEIVYACWAVMLRNLVETVTRCVSDAREVVNAQAAGRLMTKLKSRAGSELSCSIADD